MAEVLEARGYTFEQTVEGAMRALEMSSRIISEAMQVDPYEVGLIRLDEVSKRINMDVMTLEGVISRQLIARLAGSMGRDNGKYDVSSYLGRADNG